MPHSNSSLGPLIDPELFVTCRLCLENKGDYQIVPEVQDQIQYCFDIHVSLIYKFILV